MCDDRLRVRKTHRTPHYDRQAVFEVLISRTRQKMLRAKVNSRKLPSRYPRHAEKEFRISFVTSFRSRVLFKKLTGYRSILLRFVTNYESPRKLVHESIEVKNFKVEQKLCL
jgi:hypothetical protein